MHLQTGIDAFKHKKECVLTHTYVMVFNKAGSSHQSPCPSSSVCVGVWLALDQSGSLYTRTNKPAHGNVKKTQRNNCQHIA